MRFKDLMKNDKEHPKLKGIEGWKDLPFWKSALWETIQKKLQGEEYCPGEDNLFRAFAYTPLHKVKAVILGQDPYPNPNLANGLAFSVNDNIGHSFPPSLKNIFDELVEDTKCNYPQSGDLSSWAEQGVLLLNSYLSCKTGESASHRSLGWQALTIQVLKAIELNRPATVFMLWGREAEACASGISKTNTIRSAHPSPLAGQGGFGLRPFRGSRPFTKCNALLASCKHPEIDWRL
jgi:uracil-DNA glycosylase